MKKTIITIYFSLFITFCYSYDSHGVTPLMKVSAIKGQSETIKALIKSGSNINAKNTVGSTALSYASFAGNIQNTQTLINMGAKIDNNSLALACLGGHSDVVLLLISHGANVNSFDQDGFTPLMYATTSGNLKTVNVLINSGANVNAISKNILEESVLSNACSKKGNSNIVKALINSGAKVDYLSPEDETALMQAVRIGDIEIVKALVNSGANLGIKNKNGKTALDLAIKFNKYNIAKYLANEINKN
ncbi:ankyrin repeat domain-containing protein [Francisella uliginis]|uniref:Uncharacterized protein n=1 Tax=Francisella uliginis TaxID=573570 RepID=A0A1L4BUZ1_9GAMM|nr:ankyrin repeat domain-containing protein [Francisella uliginis]API87647.1 hypothetical protein F7310_09930 [Francisella uliginis]